MSSNAVTGHCRHRRGVILSSFAVGVAIVLGPSLRSPSSCMRTAGDLACSREACRGSSVLLIGHHAAPSHRIVASRCTRRRQRRGRGHRSRSRTRDRCAHRQRQGDLSRNRHEPRVEHRRSGPRHARGADPDARRPTHVSSLPLLLPIPSLFSPPAPLPSSAVPLLPAAWASGRSQRVAPARLPTRRRPRDGSTLAAATCS